MEDFIHLHVHSQYSLLDGQASIQKMVEKAIGNEMRGMALTDHGNMFGVKDFFDCCINQLGCYPLPSQAAVNEGMVDGVRAGRGFAKGYFRNGFAGIIG